MTDKSMKMTLKTTVATLVACAMPLLSAQETPAGDPPAKEEATKEIKPEGPLEERAFKMFDLLAQLPDILGSVKDEASLKTAQEKLDTLGKKLDTEVTALKKLPVPSNETRIALDKKMEPKNEAMQQKMMKVMMGMSEIDPALAPKIDAAFMGFGQKMETIGPVIDQYFVPDTEEEGDPEGGEGE